MFSVKETEGCLSFMISMHIKGAWKVISPIYFHDRWSQIEQISTMKLFFHHSHQYWLSIFASDEQ